MNRTTARRAWASLYDEALARRRARGERGLPRVLVGTATCGRAAGALPVWHSFQEAVAGAGVGAELVQVGCLGHCYAEPMAVIARPGYPPLIYGYLTPEVAARLVQDSLAGDDPCLEFLFAALEPNDLFPSLADLPRSRYETRLILRRCGLIDPSDIYDYIADEGYAGLEKALGIDTEAVIAEVEASGLRGRGGAGFPTARKWRICRDAAPEEKFVVCNADEGDPGAFMDRAVLESDPHAVVEGMAIAAHAVGAHRGYIYVRAEYPLAVERAAAAVEQAREVGLLGEDVLGSGFGFDIEVVQGAGAFVCGEETALILSLEGKRGTPYPRPPYPATQGLWGRPTLINNVKTLASVPPILVHGAPWFSALGTDGNRGTAVFALAGKVVNTGLVEVPLGATLRQVVFEVGGGTPNEVPFKAVQIGGPSGGCLPESLLDTPIDFDSLTAAGAMMGSGGLVVMDADNCMVEAARYFLEFTQQESCGRCSLCRLGTRHMLDSLEAITKGEGRVEDLAWLEALAQDIKEGSLCGLGRTAPNPVLTTLRYFREEYLAHIEEKRCPAGACPSLTAYYIVPGKCERSCDACVATCPVDCIFTGRKRFKVIDQEACVKCGTCQTACPPQYRAIVRVSPLSSLTPSEPRPEPAEGPRPQSEPAKGSHATAH